MPGPHRGKFPVRISCSSIKIIKEVLYIPKHHNQRIPSLAARSLKNKGEAQHNNTNNHFHFPKIPSPPKTMFKKEKNLPQKREII
jgi:hypothetical protein